MPNSQYTAFLNAKAATDTHALYNTGMGSDTSNGGYTLYATQSNTVAGNSTNNGGAVGTVTDVGAYTNFASHYGTFDQGGNVFEWNDAIVSTDLRGLRGGSFDTSVNNLQSSFRGLSNPASEGSIIGFRVSSLAPIL